MTDASITSSCDPARLCRRWRTCDRCAAIRQAKIADMAELIETEHGELHLTVIVPDENTAAAIKKLRASLIRRSLAPAGIWTVETGGQFAGLHLNIISPPPRPLKFPNARTYSEKIAATTRLAAAYIAKRSGIPPAQQYTGQLYGSWRSMHDSLTAPDAPPLVQGATLEHLLTGRAPETLPAEPLYFSLIPPKTDNLTKADYEKIARRHLPHLFAAAGKMIDTNDDAGQQQKPE